MKATTQQQNDLKALAEAVLQRNNPRNQNATEDENPCNLYTGNLPEKLHDVCQDGTDSVDHLEFDYLQLLTRFWKLDDDPSATSENIHRLIGRLDELYQELHRQGRRVPVRLPLERCQTAT
jgi:hypothetical protein